MTSLLTEEMRKRNNAVSFSYLSQDGIVEKNNYSRYNARINLTNQLLPNLKLTTRASGIYSNVKNHLFQEATRLQTICWEQYNWTFRFPGLTPSILSDGSYAVGPE